MICSGRKWLLSRPTSDAGMPITQVRPTAQLALAGCGRAIGPYAEEDCSVPRTRLPELFRSVREIAERYGLLVVSYGHAADGNIHVNIVEPPGERERWLVNCDGAIREIFRSVVAMGGTITGEHGVGLTQRPYLSIRHPPEVLEAMRALKRAFDPGDILNPGKIFA